MPLPALFSPTSIFKHPPNQRRKTVSQYEILIQHLPKNHEKIELNFEADAKYRVREIQANGKKAAYSANTYGTFTVFKWW
jgi:hypothetical protein